MSETASIESTTSGVDSKASGQSNESSASKESHTESNQAYQKALAEKRNWSEKAKLLESRLKELEQEKMARDGQKDELISALQKEAKDLRESLTKTKKSYAYNSVLKQVELKAAEMGCVDTQLLTKALDLDSLTVTVVSDDDYRVDESALLPHLEKLRKEKSFLFKQAAPNFKDGVPASTSGVITSKQVDFSKMSLAEMKEYAKKQNIK